MVFTQRINAQHAADFIMTQYLPEFVPQFKNKPIDCFRVDGAGDENPGFDEVQFNWTERHLEEGRVCTLVTTRYSGGSYLNRVELLNGCIAVGHSGVFIPSTIHGSNVDEASGDIDREKLNLNLKTAMEVYLDRVNGTTFAGKQITFLRGAADDLASKYQERRARLTTFLKGPQYKKRELKTTHPEEYEHFTKIWNLRSRHMVKHVAANYVFMLILCYQKDCPHPVCMNGKDGHEYLWYEGGPEVGFSPLPVADEDRPWGSENCKSCTELGKNFCNGHHKNAEEIMRLAKEGKETEFCKPPRDIIKEKIDGSDSPLSEEDIVELARKCMLPKSEVEMFADHLVQIYKRRKASGRKRKEKRAKQQTREGLVQF